MFTALYESNQKPMVELGTSDPTKKKAKKEDYSVISLSEFTSIANEYQKNKTSQQKYDETVTELDKTLNKKEPKHGIWLFDEIDEEVEFLDQLASEQQHVTNRPRGAFVWNETLNRIMTMYCSEIDFSSQEHCEKEYEALRIMDQAYLKKEDSTVREEVPVVQEAPQQIIVQTVPEFV